MPYRIEIYETDGSPVYYDLFELTHMPDEMIREVKIDDARVDPVDMFATIGRKCKVVISLVNNGFIVSRGFSQSSHPKYAAWFPFVFVVLRDDEVIFIGACKKSAYEVDQLAGTESFYLSDAVDIWVSLARETQDYSIAPLNKWTAEDTITKGLSILDDWGDMLSSRGVAPLPISYYLSNIYLPYPGYSYGDLAGLWLLHENEQLFQKHRVAHLVSGTHSNGEPYYYIYVSLFVTYWRNVQHYAAGYVMVIDAQNPFSISDNVLTAAKDAANGDGIQFVYRHSSLIAIINDMKSRNIVPSDWNQEQDYTIAQHFDTTVNIVADHAFTVSGRYYPQTQYALPKTKDFEIVKAMLICNLAILDARPYSTFDNVYYTHTQMRSVITLDYDEIEPYAKFFTSSEITHYKKTSTYVDTRMYDALSVLADSDTKQAILPNIYNATLDGFRYLYTFSVHSSVQNVNNVDIGSRIGVAGIYGDLIVIARSAKDSDGLITLTAAGGY